MMGDSSEEERWLPIAGYEGRYEVSSLGRIRSLPRTEMSAGGRRVVKGCVLKNCPSTDGYLQVPLRLGGKLRVISVHRLVAEAFVPGKNELHKEVAHLDGVRDNPRADNLQWVGRVQNHSHRRAHGTWPSGENHPGAKLNDEAVRYIKEVKGKSRARDIATRFGVSPHTIYDIWRGKRWAHLGTGSAR